MSDKDTGGTAFPVTEANYQIVKWSNEGMTLRDYFAAKATEDDIRHFQPTGRTVGEVVEYGPSSKRRVNEPEILTREQARYRFADAMLEAREMTYTTTHPADGGDLVIEFDYQPEEDATDVSPGTPESVYICDVMAGGFSILDLCSDKALARFEESCLEHMAHLRECAECDRADARMEA